MRLSLKLSIGLAAAIAALACMATAATAQLEVRSEPGGEHCPEVTQVSHHVEGGCHIEIYSTEPKTLVVFIPQKTTVSSCDLHVEARIGEDGAGWITAAALTQSAFPVPCTRAPCDEANGAMIPWPISISENGVGDEVGELAFCIRPVSSPSGGTGTVCQLHIPVTNLGSHEYEIGQGDLELCEGSSPPTGFEGFNFAYEEDSERIEIVH